jgi:hypothetical protein
VMGTPFTTAVSVTAAATAGINPSKSRAYAILGRRGRFIRVGSPNFASDQDSPSLTPTQWLNECDKTKE